MTLGLAQVNRVLLVDDEPALLDLLQTFLKIGGLQSVGFSSPVEAINYYRQHAHQIDLCVLDMQMREMSGVSCFRAIRQFNRSAKVVLLSGCAKGEEADSLLNEGALQYFRKPLEYPALVDWIKRTLGEAVP